MCLMNLECQLYPHGATSGLCWSLSAWPVGCTQKHGGKPRESWLLKKYISPNTGPVSVRTQEQGRSWRFQDLLSKIWSKNSSPDSLPSSFPLQQVSLLSAASQPRTPCWHRDPDCYVCTAQLKQPFPSETNPPDLIHLFPGPMHTSSLLKRHFIMVGQKVDLQTRAQSF